MSFEEQSPNNSISYKNLSITTLNNSCNKFVNKTISSQYQGNNYVVYMFNLLTKYEVVILANSIVYFKEHMLNSLTEYIILEIKKYCPFDLANEFNFEISFYFETSVQSFINFWFTNNNYTWNIQSVNDTTLGIHFPTTYTKCNIHLKFDCNFNLINNPPNNYSENINFNSLNSTYNHNPTNFYPNNYCNNINFHSFNSTYDPSNLHYDPNNNYKQNPINFKSFNSTYNC